MREKFPIIQSRIDKAVSEYCKEHGLQRFQSQIVKLATVSILNKNASKVYSALSYDFRTTGEISKRVNLSSNTVSTTLDRIYKETALIQMKRDGRNKSWCKNLV